MRFEPRKYLLDDALVIRIGIVWIVVGHDSPCPNVPNGVPGHRFGTAAGHEKTAPSRRRLREVVKGQATAARSAGDDVIFRPILYRSTVFGAGSIRLISSHSAG